MQAIDHNGPLTAQRLRHLLDYDRETGIFIWRVTNGLRGPAGSVAGHLHKQGYVRIKIDNRLYRAHRLAWLYVTGDWPKVEIDHRDMNRANNRFGNLRDATRSQNKGNGRAYAGSETGVKGVYRVKTSGKRQYRAILSILGSRHHLGYFATPEEASAAYYRAAEQHFGTFARAA